MKLYPIRENHLFSKAYTKGRRAVTSTFAVYILPDYKAERLARANPQKRRINRIGISVSKKLGGAVERSRAKRVLREGFRMADSGRLKTGFLIVIAARDGALVKKSTDAAADFRYAFSKLGMYSK